MGYSDGEHHVSNESARRSSWPEWRLRNGKNNKRKMNLQKSGDLSEQDESNK
jgi:hypothetical protein